LEEAQRGGYEVIVLPSMVRAIDPFRDWQGYKDLVELLQRLGPEIVHTHSSKAGIIGRFAARKAGVPSVVHTIHGMSFNRTQSEWTQALYRYLERIAARRTDRIITVADAMIDQSVEAGMAPREKFRTIYSGMRTEIFDPARYDRAAVRREWGFSDEHMVVGTIARLFSNKGYEQLIPAMADAAACRPELRFVWVGDGTQRAEYEAELEYRGLRCKTHLVGLVEPTEVGRMAAGMDVLVHASQWEGLPRAAVQALLVRVPVISFDIDGAPEVVIPGRTGVLVELNDAKGLAQATCASASDKPAGNCACRGSTGKTWWIKSRRSIRSWRGSVLNVESDFDRNLYCGTGVLLVPQYAESEVGHRSLLRLATFTVVYRQRRIVQVFDRALPK
jgi:glycosyltransferase involved in cell wall biosynthesis